MVQMQSTIDPCYLLNAVVDDHADLVRRCLMASDPIDSDSSKEALDAAIEGGNFEIIWLLLDDHRVAPKFSANKSLVKACRNFKSLDFIKNLVIGLGADPAYDNYTALRVCIYNRRIDVLSFLLNNVDLNGYDLLEEFMSEFIEDEEECDLSEILLESLDTVMLLINHPKVKVTLWFLTFAARIEDKALFNIIINHPRFEATGDRIDYCARFSSTEMFKSMLDHPVIGPDMIQNLQMDPVEVSMLNIDKFNMLIYDTRYN